MTMFKPKAILETRFLYPYCCKSANMPCNMIAVCSSEHAQPLAEVVVNSLVTHTHLVRPPAVSKEKVTKPHSQGCCGAWTFKVVYTCMFILTTPGYGSFFRIKWPPCRVNTWAAGLCQLLERKRCCGAKKENKHCENFRTKPFSQR